MAEPMIPKGVPVGQIFYITFGVKFYHQDHPEGMSPAGYVIIVAPDEDAARVQATVRFGTDWAFIYDWLDVERDRFHPDSYPKGVLAVYYAPTEDDDE